MSSTVINQAPFLRTSRNFPSEINQLAVEVNRTYVDIANIVNNRTIGLFPVNVPAINGESWFLLKNQRQQALRQVFTFTTTADIDIGFKLSRIGIISPKSYGVFTDGTSFFGLIFASSVAIIGQISFYVTTGSSTSDVIKFVSGAGAPTLTSGTIVLEWLSLP